MEGFRLIFGDLPDPRDINAQHDLSEVLFIALAASLCGANSCVEFAEFGQAKAPLLKRFLTLKHGIPSHDTFSRVFRRLDPEAFEAALARFVARLGAALGIELAGGVVALDGKSLRRAYEKGCAHMPPLTVSAYLSQTRLVLAQTLAPDGGEIEGTLKLLDLIALKGATVTADALHCTKKTTAALRARKAHYVLALKGNRSTLARDADALLAAAKPGTPTAETREDAHGRAERRRAIVVPAPGLARRHGFVGLLAVGRIEAWRSQGEKTTQRTRTFILSRKLTPAQLLTTVREHWGIENGAHSPLDVVFDEDRDRTRRDHGPRNLAVLRRIALNILRTHPAKQSLNVKRHRAGWNDDFLLELMTHMR